MYLGKTSCFTIILSNEAVIRLPQSVALPKLSYLSFDRNAPSLIRHFSPTLSLPSFRSMFLSWTPSYSPPCSAWPFAPCLFGWPSGECELASLFVYVCGCPALRCLKNNGWQQKTARVSQRGRLTENKKEDTYSCLFNLRTSRLLGSTPPITPMDTAVFPIGSSMQKVTWLVFFFRTDIHSQII